MTQFLVLVGRVRLHAMRAANALRFGFASLLVPIHDPIGAWFCRRESAVGEVVIDTKMSGQDMVSLCQGGVDSEMEKVMEVWLYCTVGTFWGARRYWYLPALHCG